MKIYDEKINNYLSELSDEYKDLLAQEAIKQSNDGEVSAVDLIKIDSEVKDYLINRTRRKKEKRFQLYGALYILMGLMCYTFSEMFYTTNGFSSISNSVFLQLLALALICSGAVIFSFPMFFSYRKTNHANKRDYNGGEVEHRKILEYNIISLWTDLEGVCMSLLGDNAKYRGPISVIRFLIERDIIDSEESRVLNELLRLRNKIVHYSGDSVDIDEMEKILYCSESIISKIHVTLLNNKDVD